MRRLLFVFVMAFLGCSSPGLKPGEGHIDVPGGKVWYRIVGSGTATPLLLLHGGPGAPSFYLNPLARLADERPVIFYDQLGCGRSAGPTDSTLWRTERFVEELAAVRQALGLKQVHILGHSWGTMLATEYMITKPQGVKSLILASAALSIPHWLHDADSLKKTLPDSVQAAIARHESDGTFDAPEYQGAVMEYYKLYVSRSNPWSADIDSTFTQLGMQVYMTMWGPSEFTATGSLKNYDITNRLHEIEVPTLFTCGRYDEATPAAVQYYQSLVPGAKLAILENSAHLTMQDEPDRYAQVVRDFLHEVESK
jgi:proline iminopeptidase